MLAHVTYCPRKSFVLVHLWNIKRLHSILDILGIHIINLVCIIVSVEIEKEMDSVNCINYLLLEANSNGQLSM